MKVEGHCDGTAHAQLKSVYGLSRVTCHRKPGPPITSQRSEGLVSWLVLHRSLRRSLNAIGEVVQLVRALTVYYAALVSTLFSHLLSEA